MLCSLGSLVLRRVSGIDVVLHRLILLSGLDDECRDLGAECSRHGLFVISKE